MVVTKEHLQEARTIKGGYVLAQIKIARELTGIQKHPMRKLYKMDIPQEKWDAIIAAKREKFAVKPKPILNAVSVKPDGWNWKPEQTDVQPIKRRKKEKKPKQPKKRKEKKVERVGFFASREWLELRYRVIKKYGACCMACGRNYRRHRVVIHVDHIKPRSKYPSLELVFENLQVLCEDCNVGKSNKDQTDWRPDYHEKILEEDESAELEIVNEARNHI